MKIFSFILALFFSFLISAPCSDEISASDNQASISQQHSETNKSDICSPLCICACCGVQLNILKLEPLNFSTELPAILTKISTFHSTFQFDILYGIWQPPKIC